jgi:hypothetical protein
MSQEVVVATIAGIASIGVAIITAYFAARRQTDQATKDFTNKITALEIKVDLLWKTYVVDAVKASRSAGLVATQSKIAPTEKWEDLLPDDLRLSIGEQIEKYSQYTQDPYDISIQVTKSMEDELVQFSYKHNINMKIIIGAIYVLAENHDYEP